MTFARDLIQLNSIYRIELISHISRVSPKAQLFGALKNQGVITWRTRDFFRLRWTSPLNQPSLIVGGPFYTISLRLKSSRKPPFNAEKVAEQWPELQGQKKASIGDNLMQEPMVTYYHVYDDLCKPGCIKGDFDRFVGDYLPEPINDDQNRVVTVIFPINWDW